MHIYPYVHQKHPKQHAYLICILTIKQELTLPTIKQVESFSLDLCMLYRSESAEQHRRIESKPYFYNGWRKNILATNITPSTASITRLFFHQTKRKTGSVWYSNYIYLVYIFYVYIYICTHVCVCVCVRVCMYVCMCLCVWHIFTYVSDIRVHEWPCIQKMYIPLKKYLWLLYDIRIYFLKVYIYTSRHTSACTYTYVVMNIYIDTW